jgi:hypothetical protein
MQFVFYGDALALKPGAKRKELLDAMRRHVLAQGDLVCIFQKPAPEARKWVGRSRYHTFGITFVSPD